MKTKIDAKMLLEPDSILAPDVEGVKKEVATVKSRFGELQINLRKSIYFNYGLLGIPEPVHFCLANFPNPGMEQFKLLQCVEDDTLCFISIPAEYNNEIIDINDLNESCESLGIDKNNLLIFFLVSVKNKDGKQQISINARAPIFIDVKKRTGLQHVIQNPSYKIEHIIS